ncbi:MAG: cell division protein ZapA [Magnetospirillum sp.]|nr:cell division protein ZapA [Magnetospirillum sp.]
MALVTVSVAGRLYDIACDDAQASSVRELAAALDERAERLESQVGMQPEARFLVMLGLTLADELAEARAEIQRLAGDLAAVADGDARLAEGIARMAERIDAVAARLERS